MLLLFSPSLLKYQTFLPNFPTVPQPPHPTLHPHPPVPSSKSTLSTRLHSILQCRSQYVPACLCVLRWTQGRPIYSSAARVRERKQKWSASLQRIQSLTASSSAAQVSKRGQRRREPQGSQRPSQRMFDELTGRNENELELFSIGILAKRWELLHYMHTWEILLNPT